MTKGCTIKKHMPGSLQQKQLETRKKKLNTFACYSKRLNIDNDPLHIKFLLPLSK